MNQLTLPCCVGKVSDGHHTFEELYEHRNHLFIALMQAHKEKSWRSQLHDDSSAFMGWFIAGIDLPTGTITYHMPDKLWALTGDTGCKTLTHAPKWDGHTPAMVIQRLFHLVDIPF